MKAYEQTIRKLDGSRGAPMGRCDIGERPTDQRIYDRQILLDYGGYDKGGAYWGVGGRLRVSYTKDLSYIHYYWEDDEYRENYRAKKLPLEELPLLITKVQFDSSKKIISKRLGK